MLVFDLSNYNTLEELKHQIEVKSQKRYEEIEDFDSIPEHLKYRYYTSYMDILSGIKQVENLSNQSSTLKKRRKTVFPATTMPKSNRRI